MYNYLEEMYKDVENYIDNEITLTDYSDREELQEHLHDTLWTEDSVTGNASGSYTCNRMLARCYVTDNMDLLNEMCQEFGVDAETIGSKFLSDDWEWFDVSIRCYLLGGVISKVLDDLYEEE